MTPHAKKIEDAMGEAMDLMAATGEQPTDPRAWSHLLIYCPEEIIAARMTSIRDNREIRHTIDDVLRDLHYGSISLAEARARIVWAKAGHPNS
jgi:hypothetical protein